MENSYGIKEGVLYKDTIGNRVLTISVTNETGLWMVTFHPVGLRYQEVTLPAPKFKKKFNLVNPAPGGRKLGKRIKPKGAKAKKVSYRLYKEDTARLADLANLQRGNITEALRQAIREAHERLRKC
jgi:hypothetical protein